MNKHLLSMGLGILFLSNTYSQNKVAYSIPRNLPAPLPAFAAASSQKLYIDDHLRRQNNQLVSLKSDGDTLFVSGLKRNQLEGNWKSFYSVARPLDSGRLHKSVPDGEWKTWYPDGSPRTVRTYSAEKLAYVKNEIRRKEGRHNFYAITAVAKQNMAAARHLLTASYSYHGLDNTQDEKQYNSLEKRVAHNTEAGSYYAPFEECLHHGLYINYFPGGKIKDSGYYKNGVRDGLWKEWNHEGNLLAVGVYRKGKPSGDWKFYNQYGKLLYIQLYSNSGKLKETVKMKS